MEVILSGDVPVQAGADTLGVAHLAEDPPVGGGNPLHSPGGAVGVEVWVHGGQALQVCVLGGNLAVFRQGFQKLRGTEEAALAMGSGDGADRPGGHPGQPGGLVGDDAGIYDLGLVPPDGIEGEGGAVLVRVPDFAVGHQPQLDEGLEAVADAQGQAIPVLEEVHDRLGGLRAPEEGGDELAGAVGLVAAGEAAGEEENLASPKGLGKAGGGLRHVLGGLVAHDEDFRLQARPLGGPGAVILAVGAGEDGDENLGL